MAEMSIELVDHACLVIETGSVRLVTDPWLTGRVFENGWEHLTEDRPSLTELAPNIIWISHEHPDHFSPSTLKSVPQRSRPDITVIYSVAVGSQIAAYCAELGFSTLPIPLDKPLGFEEFTFRSGPVGSDSWLWVESDTTILNLNDCRLADASALQNLRSVVGSPDVLATQFSYANWVGNPGDSELPRIARRMTEEQIRSQIDVLEPDWVLPFAAHIRFCHSENSWWNATAPSPEWAADVIKSTGHFPIVLAPNERWTIGREWDSPKSISKWSVLMAKAIEHPLQVSESVDLSALTSSFTVMQQLLYESHDWAAVIDLANAGLLPATLVRVPDLQLTLSFDVIAGLSVVDALEDWDISLSSEALSAVLRTPYGRGTLTINGRFVANYETLNRFFTQTQLFYATNVGLRFPDSLSIEALLAPPSFPLQLVELAKRTHAT